MNAALCFRDGNALHAVSARFELELRIGAATDDADDRFLVAPEFAFVARNNFGLPPLALRVAEIHAENVARKERRFIAPGARADFKEDVPFVVGVLRNELEPERFLKTFKLRLRLGSLFLSELAHLGVFSEFFSCFEVRFRAFVLGELYRDRFDFGALAREVAELIHVGCGFRSRKHAVDFLKPPGERGEFRADGVVKHFFGAKGFRSFCCQTDEKDSGFGKDGLGLSERSITKRDPQEVPFC